MPSAPKYRSKPRAESSTAAAAGPSRPKPKPLEQRDPSGIPGVSKLKASIRQTRRLLAKDNLEPGLKIQTQRRLTSLEADLAKAEKREVEKKNGERYHMVKFFERQKLLRIIKRLKRSLEAPDAESERLTRELEEARIMLNYVLHYPNDKKYIALFPSTDKSDKLSLPPILSSTATDGDKGEKRRLDILTQIRSMMERGEISAVPEEGERQRVQVPSEATTGNAQEEKQVKGGKGGKGGKKETAEDEDEDDFFENE